MMKKKYVQPACSAVEMEGDFCQMALSSFGSGKLGNVQQDTETNSVTTSCWDDSEN